MKRYYSAEQLAYIDAKAAFAVIEAEYQAARDASVQPLERHSTEADIDVHCAALESIDDRFGYSAARRALIDAECGLMAWASLVIATDKKTAARYGEVAHVFTQAPKFPKIREKLIDACMRLEAPKQVAA